MYQIIGEVLVLEQHSIQLWKVQTTELIYFSLKALNYINLVCRLSKFAKYFRKEENI